MGAFLSLSYCKYRGPLHRQGFSDIDTALVNYVAIDAFVGSLHESI